MGSIQILYFTGLFGIIVDLAIVAALYLVLWFTFERREN